MRNYLGIILGLALSTQAWANPLTVRDIKLLGGGKVEIQLDGTAPRGSLEMEYVRDIVQFSIQNATIYPAKILHSEEGSQAFSKVFAYQYAPNLVRVRFSVDAKADLFDGKVKWEQKGKTLTLNFPEDASFAKNAAEKADKTEKVENKEKDSDSNHERSLLAKVLGTNKENNNVEKIDDKEVEAPKTKSSSKAEKIAKAEAADSAQASDSEKAESQPVLRSDKKKSANNNSNDNSENSTKLGGARNGPSPIRSFLAMFLVVGGLGLVLLYVKKKKNTVQAKKVGDSWISNIFANNKKQKALIEVVANHPLGPKQSITIVRIRGQQLVLGVTEGNVQLITQLDSDDEIDVFDDPKVADSIGKLFGASTNPQQPAVKINPSASRNTNPVARATGTGAVSARNEPEVGASFGSLLKGSTGAGAIVARNAYNQQQTGAPSKPRAAVAAPQSAQSVQNGPLQSSVRDQIKQRLAGMRN